MPGPHSLLTEATASRPRCARLCAAGVSRRGLLAVAAGLTSCVSIPEAASNAHPAPAPADPGPPAVPPAEPLPPEMPPEPPPGARPSEPAAPSFQPTIAKLTEDGCCSNPVWAPDSRRVLYYDKPAEGLGGTWSIDVETGGATIVAPRAGFFSPDLSLQAVPSPATQTLRIYQVGGPGVVTVRSAASSAAFAPDSSQLLCTVRPAQTTGGPLLAPVVFRVLRADGAEDRRVATLVGGNVVEWFPDGRQALVTGRASTGVDAGIWRLDTVTGQLTEIFRTPRISGVQIAPTGEWIAFLSTFQPDPALSGVWVMRPDGSRRHRLDFAGSYRWAPGGDALIAIPLRGSATEPYVVYRVDIASGQMDALTDALQVDLRIATYDWSLSPDGRRIAYVSSTDYAIWCVQLAP